MGLTATQIAAMRRVLETSDNPNGVYTEFDEQTARTAKAAAKAAAVATNTDDLDDEEADDDDMMSESEEEEVVAPAPKKKKAVDPKVRAEKQRAHEARMRQQKEEKAAHEEAKKQLQEQKSAIDLAKSLAHNDKTKRDRSIGRLRKWLIARESLTSQQLMMVWKGLFYSMWLSDKVPVQQALADALSDLLLPPLPFERSLALFEAGLFTLAREWTAIDQLRMDKFMTLARRFLQKSLVVLQRGEWEQPEVEQWTETVLQSGVLAPDTHARGFAFHLLDCFLREVERVSSTGLPITFHAFNTLLTPFYYILVQSHDRALVERTCKEVWDPLVELTMAPMFEADEQEHPKAKAQKPKQSKQKKSKKVPSEETDDEDMEGAEEQQEEEVEQSLPQAEGAAAEYPTLQRVCFGEALQIAGTFKSLVTGPNQLLPRSIKMAYKYAADFEAADQRQHEQPEEDVPMEEEVPVIQLPTKKSNKKRKADAAALDANVERAVAGVGSESLGAIVKEKAKKKNKKQRLADKRRKKEALLAGATGHQPAPTPAAPVDEDEMNGAEEDDEDNMDFDAHAMLNLEDDAELEMDEIDDDGFDAELAGELDEDDDDDVGVLEAEEEAPVVQPTVSKKEQQRLEAALAKHQQQQALKKGTKKRVVPEPVVEEVPEEEEERHEEESQPQPAKKKQRVSLQQPQAAAPSTPVNVKSKPAKQQSPVKQPSPAKVAPSSPAQQPTTPPKQLKASQKQTATVAASSVSFSTPQAKAAPSKPSIGGTSVRPTAPAPTSSMKKAVRILEERNQVKSFKKWSRDSITKETSELLNSPFPKSAIKPASMQYFLQHNKNGRELAARQSALAAEFAAAAPNSPSTPTRGGSKSTPPVSPRAKAADYFFKQ